MTTLFKTDAATLEMIREDAGLSRRVEYLNNMLSGKPDAFYPSISLNRYGAGVIAELLFSLDPKYSVKEDDRLLTVTASMREALQEEFDKWADEYNAQRAIRNALHILGLEL